MEIRALYPRAILDLNREPSFPLASIRQCQHAGWLTSFREFHIPRTCSRLPLPRCLPRLLQILLED